MSNIFETETKIKQIIDELKALSAQAGLANQGEEERIITSVFLYKFLNDKFMYNLSKFAEEIGETIEEILKNENDELDAFYDTTSGDVAFGYEDTIQYLINHVEQADFYKQFDDALVRIAQNTRNDIFAVETAEGSYRPLFEAISTPVEPSNRNNFAKNIFGIIAQDKFDFSSAFAGSFDFYSTIFEYLIKDYNVASGVYAEYFTPQSVSSIIARCLVGMSDKVEASEISDPAAGSGSLVLHLAHELGQENGLNRAIVYTQDISSKSTRFLRLNMMLNGMTESLGHIIQGDTLLNPAHFQVEHEPTSGLKKYAYQTANPPFKLDFSSTRDAIEQKWSETDRFFAGVPKIPASKKESMAIYLLFIQHIMYCMKDNGKYGELVYAGFLIKFHLDDTKVTPKYMKYYTISQTYRNWVNNGPTGSTRGNMSEGDFADMPVFLPSRKQQDAIVNLFSPFDEKIDNNNAIAAELEGMAKDLYDYWFVQFDFPDENGKPYKSSGGKMVWNEELKREIPEGWEVYQLDELFRFVKGRIPTEVFDTNDGNNLIPYLTIEAVNAVPTSYCKKQGMITTAGDTIMVMDGAASSETYVGHYGALGSTFAKLEKVNGRVTDSFVYVIMQKYQSVFKKVNTGSTVPHANKDYISKFKVVLPQDDCLKNMAIKFDTWVQKQIQVREENAELTSLRDFLLPMLMNGQVKVKGRDI